MFSLCKQKIIYFKKLIESKSPPESSITLSDALPVNAVTPNITHPVEILPRQSDDNPGVLKRLYPIKPYHERWKEYALKRTQLFGVCELLQKRPKRSTLRLRKYYKKRKEARKCVISSITHNSKDKRYYAFITFLNFSEYGLLDTGANISCIGSNLALTDFSNFKQFFPTKSFVKTADGTVQQTLGFLEVEVSFRDQTKRLKFLIVPKITQRVILGLDFWKAFNLAADVFHSAFISEGDILSNPTIAATNIAFNSEFDNLSTINDNDNVKYPLTSTQITQLRAIIKLFPDFSEQGLGRTKLIEHDIDVGDSRPVKQRFYPVSPAVEKLMFQEIDRMLALGVIEPSSSSWSSPMRLVLKPNKVRLCLDARRPKHRRYFCSPPQSQYYN